MATPSDTQPQADRYPVLFGIFGLWPSMAAIQGIVTHLAEYGFHTLKAVPWPERPGIDEPAQDPAWVDAYLRSRFPSPVSTQTPGLWLRHTSRPWGHHIGGLGDFCTGYGLAGLWLAPSVGPAAKPEGYGGCIVWLPGVKVRTFAFHLDDPWPEPALHLLRTPCLAMPASAHGRMKAAKRGQNEQWPAWMLAQLGTETA